MRNTSGPSLLPEGKPAFPTQNINRISLSIPKWRLQVCELSLGEPKYEILRKALRIAAHLFVEPSRMDAVELGEVRVEHHPLTANDKDATRYCLDPNEFNRFVVLGDSVLPLSPLQDDGMHLLMRS